MPRRLACAALPALLLAGLFLSAAQSEQQSADEDRPLDSTLVERAERRLVQLDISLVPKKKRDDSMIPTLSAEDLQLLISGSRIDIRYADRICHTVDSAPAPEELSAETFVADVADTPERTPEEIPTGRGTYLFCFEHNHLTMAGQENALGMAEQMIPKLVGRGALGMIVSSGRKLLQSELSDDPDELLEFLGQIRRDHGQWGAGP